MEDVKVSPKLLARTFRFPPLVVKRLTEEAYLRKMEGQDRQSQNAIVEEALTIHLCRLAEKREAQKMGEEVQ